ncbi:MAG TPA: ROK family transcriptional regulator [Pseudonocardiaceae bacterium]|jgi:predicted NBD/HSP70 family sugar kinase|nr:ROK family transcriptional regulator [Pseudonocardiaceae bacterium]
MRSAPGSLSALRGSNRLRVIETVRRRGGASRVELVRETGLSRSTVSSVVADLLTERVLVEQRDHPGALSASGVGRPATQLTLNPDIGALVGVHLRHDGVRVAIADLAGTLRAESLGELDVDHHAHQAIGYVLDQVPALLAEAGVEEHRLLGVGVAVSAPIRTGPDSQGPPQLWRGVDVVSELGAAIGVPAYLDNDANLGAMAEWIFGAARGTDDLVYVMMADGVGAGLIVDGRLHRGAHGAAGELGHVVVSPDGQVCRCGSRGCLETVSGTEALTASLRHSHGPDVSLPAVLDLVRTGDPGACRAVTDAGRAVGKALAGICAVLDPRLVVVGGRLAAAGVPLLDGVREELLRWLPPSLGGGLTVLAGQLGARAEVLGAIAMAGRQQPAPAFVDVTVGRA